MQIIAWMPLIFGMAPQTFLVDEVLTKIEEHQGRFITAVRSFASDGERIYGADHAEGTLWLLDTKGRVEAYFGGPGKGPGELQRFITSLTLDDGELKVIHANGYRMEIFDWSGNHVDSYQTGNTPLIHQVANHGFYAVANPGSVEWRQADQDPLQIDLTAGKGDEGVSLYLAQHLGPYVFLCSRSGQQNRVYYVLADLETGSLADRASFSLTMTSAREDFPADIPADAVLRIHTLAGLTVSPELGFVMDESTLNRQKYDSPRWGQLSVLHCYQPRTQTRTTMKVFMNGHPAIIAFQHLKEDVWATAVSGAIQIVRLRKMSVPQPSLN